jgi:hypothetical protein
MPMVEPNVLDNPNRSARHMTAEDRRKKRSQKNIEENREVIQLANDIYPVPEVVNKDRREQCKYNFKLFCETYHPNKFELRWSPVHLDLISTMENAVLRDSGTLCYACFRGFGKTSLAETLAQWSLLYGHKSYIVIIAATNDLAKNLVKSQVLELETNETLFEDFPEVCYPLRSLERNFVRALHQHCDSVPTRIQYKSDGFTFPCIKDSVSSGSKVHSVGLTGSLRGLKHTLPTGKVIRPDFVIIDDPQTDNSAKSDVATSTRERIIQGAIAGLSGPRTSMTAIMPCTVIRVNDLAERFLDNQKRPEWQGKRTSLLPKFPTNMQLWRQYADIRAESLRSGYGVKVSTQFYKDNQIAMDEGAEVSWLERFDPRQQISAIQAAMDLYFTDPVAFASEYQNQPLIESNGAINHNLTLTVDKLLERSSGMQHGIVPRHTLYLTTGIDIQAKILYYTTVAWTEDFGGIIADYGTYPRQHSFEGWTAQNPPIPMSAVDGNHNLPLIPLVFRGLEYIRDNILSKGFKRDETDDAIFVEKCLIDANWALSADAVYTFCKQNESTNVYLPSNGRAVSATMIPMEQWARKVGEKQFWNSRIRLNTNEANRGRHAIFDGNSWKTLVAERLLVPKGSNNALMFYGDNGYQHQIMMQQLCIEKPEQRKGRGRTVDEWEAEGSVVENHFWDCIVMAAVAANIAGLKVHVRTNEQLNANTGITETVTAPAPLRNRRVASPPPQMNVLK